MFISNLVENIASTVTNAVKNVVSHVGNLIEGRVDGGREAGLSQAISPSPALSTTASHRASSLVTSAATSAANDGLPAGMTQADYEKTLDFAKLSSQVYDWDDTVVAETGMALFGGIRDIRDQEFDTPNYREVSSTGNDIDWWFGNDQGLDYKVFENTDTGDMVVAFRGTEPLSLEDWAENVEQVFGDSEQYEGAIALGRDLQAQLDQYNAENGTNKQLSFTGHSLGGGLATAAALATGNEAIVFDAAGVSDGTISNNNLNTANAANITNVNVKGDWLSDWNGRQDDSTLGNGLLGQTRQYGDTVWLQGVNDRADFGGWLIPDWTNTAKLAESVLNHAWHVFTYQLENRNFA